MGGICGLVGISDRRLVEIMSHAIRYRGPHEKVLIDKGISLCSRSLDGKDGLAVNEDGQVWVSFDGEIFNKTSLEELLKSNGHDFSSSCNAETVVHLYEEYGDLCVNQLRGPFAFSLWDSRKKSLLLARDRNGERSIYFAFSDGLFLFGSEIKALLNSGLIEKRLNPYGLDYFFSWGHVPAPATLFDGIQKVPPSHLLLYEENKTTLSKYWDLDFSKIEYGTDEDEWCKRIYDILTDCVRMRLTKGPLGILLGGFDSSVLASLTRRLTDEPLKSFTISFEDEESNEPYAKFVADWLGIEAYEKTLTVKDLITIIQELVLIFDDLRADLAPTIPTFLALKTAKEHVKTVFTADGADLSFWSWGWAPSRSWMLTELRTRASRLLSKDKKVNSTIESRPSERRLTSVTHASSRIANALRLFNNDLRVQIQRAHLPSDVQPVCEAQYYLEAELKELLGRRVLINVYTPFFECVECPVNDLGSRINRMRLVNKEFEVIGGWGVERLGDICLCFSLCLRTPFEDYKLKEMTSKIPPSLKQPNEQTDKYILRKTALKYSLLPKVVAKQRKRGFGWGRFWYDWFIGNRELKDYAAQIISEGSKRVKSILREKAVSKYLRHGRPLQVLSLLMFILWYNRFFSDQVI